MVRYIYIASSTEGPGNEAIGHYNHGACKVVEKPGMYIQW